MHRNRYIVLDLAKKSPSRQNPSGGENCGMCERVPPMFKFESTNPSFKFPHHHPSLFLPLPFPPFSSLFLPLPPSPSPSSITVHAIASPLTHATSFSFFFFVSLADLRGSAGLADPLPASSACAVAQPLPHRHDAPPRCGHHVTTTRTFVVTATSPRRATVVATPQRHVTLPPCHWLVCTIAPMSSRCACHLTTPRYVSAHSPNTYSLPATKPTHEHLHPPAQVLRSAQADYDTITIQRSEQSHGAAG